MSKKVTQAKLERIIFGWVEKNFGTSEALDPSWDISALAKEILERL